MNQPTNKKLCNGCIGHIIFKSHLFASNFVSNVKQRLFQCPSLLEICSKFCSLKMVFCHHSDLSIPYDYRLQKQMYTKLFKLSTGWGNKLTIIK